MEKSTWRYIPQRKIGIKLYKASNNFNTGKHSFCGCGRNEEDFPAPGFKITEGGPQEGIEGKRSVYDGYKSFAAHTSLERKADFFFAALYIFL